VLGVAPELSRGLSLSPVDFAAQAIAHLSRQPDAQARDYHVFSRGQVTMPMLIAALTEAGIPSTLLPITDWQARLTSNVTPEMAVYPLAPALAALDLEGLDRGTSGADCEETLARLDAETLALMDVTPELLLRYIEEMIDQGFLLPTEGLRKGA